ncbi:MAG: hypothetical protein ACRDZ5_08645, partial [Acidimicrobiales bacterium]
GVREWVLAKIASEAALGQDGRITIKVNGLTDPEIIDALYEASRQGARIELVVRGLCSLRPGVPGLSDGIVVRSIVGRFLEHSRIYRFGEPGDAGGPHRPGTGDGGASHWLGSADLMERNLDRRVEVLVPVCDPELRARLDETLELNLTEDVNCWELGPDGAWSRVYNAKGISTQGRLEELALDRARKRRSAELHG